MSASAATRLRQLATQYHGGELDLQSYRRMRAELLDRLTSDSEDEAGNTIPSRPVTLPAASASAPAPLATPAAAPAAPTIPKAPKPPPAAVAKPLPAPAPPAVSTPETPPESGGKSWLIVALLAVIALGVAGYFFMRPSTGPATAAEDANTSSESYLAINDFLTADDWSDEQIANFNTRWATLPDEMRAAALDQPWYQYFVERVRSRVKERRALTATADSAGTVEGPLSALASSVGIDISSPDRVVTPRASVASTDDAASDEATAEAGSAAPKSGKTAATKPGSDAAATPVKSAAVPAAGANSGKPATGASSQAASAAGAKSAAPAAAAESPDPCRAEWAGTRKARCRDALDIGGFGPYMVGIRKGEFDMGSKESGQEEPVHHVRIDKPFAIAEHETSQEEYWLFCTETKRSCETQPWTGGDLPVVKVSWQDAHDYVTWLSKVSGNTYRLATEAEWEFAARSGTAALYPSGDVLSPTDAVFSQDEKLDAPWPRSRKINANTFKLYHSIGNVREWVQDAWSPNFEGAPDNGSARTGNAALRVVRGGAYTDIKATLRYTTREGLAPGTRDLVTGFRVVREF